MCILYSFPFLTVIYITKHPLHFNLVLPYCMLTLFLFSLHYFIYYSQKQLPSAWNESDWLANCRPIHIVKLRENSKRFS